MMLTDLEIDQSVIESLKEDLGENFSLDNDISAKLVEKTSTTASIISRENGVFCGKKLIDSVFKNLNINAKIDFFTDDGSKIEKNQKLLTIKAKTNEILSAERTCLNFIGFLSGIATKANSYKLLTAGYKTKIFDTRKTIPRLRLLQKYAVKCGGIQNHRFGLYDAFLIKENHIKSSSSIETIIAKAKEQEPNKTVEIEVENLDELQQAIKAKADIILIDNFSLEDTKKAVNLAQGKSKLEASGGINKDTILQIAATGIDRISIGDLTKNVTSLDLSLLFQ